MIRPHTPPHKDWIDFGKGISMLFVFIFHAETHIGNGDGWSFLFSAFRMPFFFFLSGYLYTSNLSQFSGRRKLKQIGRGIVIPYLIFTSVLMTLKVSLQGWPVEKAVTEILLGWASWFVVALGVAQLIFVVILHFTKSPGKIFLCSVLSITIGYAIMRVHPANLPYCINNALFVVFFFGLGLIYRLYEYKLESWISRKTFFLIAVPYFLLTFIDNRTIGTYGYIGLNQYNNFCLYLVYAVVGIFMMLCFCKSFPTSKTLNYIGRNSLIFYYLNGAVLTFIAIVVRRVGVEAIYPVILLCALSACGIIIPVSMFINKHLPIMTGKKEAFNTISRKLHLNIEW